MKVAIIGAGPAGLSAAVSAAGCGHEVTVFERKEKAAGKLLMTGNGRCNITNRDAGEISRYHGSESIRDTVISRFGLRENKEFLGSIGILLHERDGYYYPLSDQASSVRDAFLVELRRLNVRLRCGIKITGIRPLSPGLELCLGMKDGTMELEAFDSCIMCCGGRAYPATGSDGFGYKLCKKLGIDVVPALPALTKLVSKDQRLSVLDGVRAKGGLYLCKGDELIAHDSGTIQFLKNAVSGIVAFQLSSAASRLLKEGCELSVAADLMDEITLEELYDLLLQRRSELGEGRSVQEGLVTLLNDRAVSLIVSESRLDGRSFSDVTDDEIRTLCKNIKGLKFKIDGVGDYSQCQVCSGGICGHELTEGLMLKKYPGLYAAGELLDVDGICGGYNLHFAIGSGVIAGRLSG